MTEIKDDLFNYRCHYCKSKNIIKDKNNQIIHKAHYCKNCGFILIEICELWHCFNCNKDFGVLISKEVGIEIIDDKS